MARTPLPPLSLGGLTPAAFMASHWQQKPLLVRQALPGFTGFLTPSELARLAGRDDVVARSVTDGGDKLALGKRFRLKHGPFKQLKVEDTPPRYTLLVQNIERIVDDGWPLLQQFSFIPRARIDDLMVSWAKTGASVGPHVDLYDVFLLQGIGRRRWSIDDGKNVTVTDGDLRLLQNFTPTEDWVLEPGDMLYLPPGVGHHGVAVDDDCMTWSIGFSMPSQDQLVENFLAFLGMEAAHEGMVKDPGRPAVDVDATAVVDDAFVDVAAAALRDVAWDKERVATFLGRLLTGRTDVEHKAPKGALTRGAFVTQVTTGKGRLALARTSRMLLRARRVFLNGELHTCSTAAAPLFHAFARDRSVALPLRGPSGDVDDADVSFLFAAYARGELVLL